MKHFQWKIYAVSDTVLLKKKTILHLAFTVAVKCQYYFRYNNYKLKAVLADKTSGCYIGYISVWNRPISIYYNSA